MISGSLYKIFFIRMEKCRQGGGVSVCVSKLKTRRKLDVIYEHARKLCRFRENSKVEKLHVKR